MDGTELRWGEGRIAGVLMDVDGTLYHQPTLRAFMGAELLCHLLASHSLAHGRELVSVIRTFRRAREQLRCAADTLLEQEQFERVARELELGDAVVVRQIVTEWMFERPLKYLKWTRRPGLMHFLEALVTRRLALGVYSDYPARDKLSALGVAACFDTVICSTDGSVNRFKPDPKGFLRFCQATGLTPAEVLYVGDRFDVDARGAERAGMPCVIVSRRHADPAYSAETVGSYRELTTRLGLR